MAHGIRSLTWDEAERLSREKGVAIAHDLFGRREWMKVEGKLESSTYNVVFEDGVCISVHEFFKYREHKEWTIGWREWKDPGLLHKVFRWVHPTSADARGKTEVVGPPYQYFVGDMMFLGTIEEFCTKYGERYKDPKNGLQEGDVIELENGLRYEVSLKGCVTPKLMDKK